MQKHAPATIAVCLLAALATLTADSQSPQDVEGTVDGTLGIRQTTQRVQDSWARNQAELRGRHDAAQAAVAYLQDRRDIEERRVAALRARIAELERRLDESTRLESGLQDSLNIIFMRLRDHVATDLPFLPAERGARISSLRACLSAPDISGAEKLRRLLEALQIEARYGSTVEVYQDRICVAGDSLHVDLLRVGRLSVFWRTPDGRRAGEYDRAADEWVELASRHKRSIARAMEMVEHRRSFDLIALPLGRLSR